MDVYILHPSTMGKHSEIYYTTMQVHCIHKSEKKETVVSAEAKRKKQLSFEDWFDLSLTSISDPSSGLIEAHEIHS